MANPNYPLNSRYNGVETTEITLTNGRTEVFLRRRFLPPSDSLEQIDTHEVTQGERPDHIAHRYFSDPILFWRLADANDVMNPEDLTRSSRDRVRRLRITSPAGVFGPVL